MSEQDSDILTTRIERTASRRTTTTTYVPMTMQTIAATGNDCNSNATTWTRSFQQQLQYTAAWHLLQRSFNGAGWVKLMWGTEWRF